MISGHPIFTSCRRLTGCQRDPWDRGNTICLDLVLVSNVCCNIENFVAGTLFHWFAIFCRDRVVFCRNKVHLMILFLKSRQNCKMLRQGSNAICLINVATESGMSRHSYS